MAITNGSSLFVNINSGLNNAYALLANIAPAGVTQTTISKAQTNTSLSRYLNPTFASYIQTNFSNLDKNKDGILSSKEISTATHNISSQGLTQTQLTQLGTASGIPSAALSQVLEHFNNIDANHDGKITTSEISAFTLKSAEEKKKTEFANRAATNMSIFYADDSKESSPSILANRYIDEKTTKQ